jgi:hypothetical protein
MAHDTLNFQVSSPKTTATMQSGRTEGDFVINGLLLLMLLGLAAFLIWRFAGEMTVDFGVFVWNDDMHRVAKPWPVADMVGAAIVGLGTFFGFFWSRLRLVFAASAAVVAFFFLPTVDEVQATVARAQDSLFASASPVLEAAIPTLASDAQVREEMSLDAAGKVYPLPAIEAQGDVIEPAAGPSRAVPVNETPMDGLVNMADGRVVARIRVGDVWFTADVRPDLEISRINRFDLMRLGQLSRGIDNIVVPSMHVGERQVSDIALMVEMDIEARNVIGRDVLGQLGLSTGPK